MSASQVMPSDEQLMTLVQEGQSQRFGELIRRHRLALYRTALQRLGDASLAEDVVQETLMAAFRSRHTYRSEFRVRTWLWTILINQTRATLLKRRRTEEIEQARAPATNSEEPVAGLLARERRELLDKLLEQLPPEQETALRLRFFTGLKFADLAQRTGCSLATAKNRVRAGLQRLSDLCRDVDSPPLADDLSPGEPIS